MDRNKMQYLFDETNYIRTGGTKEELKCATFIKEEIEKLGLEAKLEPFKVQMADIEECKLITPIGEIKALGYRNSNSTSDAGLTAPLYYLKGKNDYDLSLCKGKIVLMIGYFGKWMYEDLLKSGALAFITTTGLQTDSHEDIDNRELRSMVSEGKEKIPGVNINIKDAIRLIDNDVKEVTIKLKQREYEADSHNVVTEIKGETDDIITFTAHYDSVPLSTGVYDNMSGSVGIFALMEKFLVNKPKHTLRFVWCGSEERGLLGSKAYVRDHEEELDKIGLVINLDMIGCILGNAIACCTTEMKLVDYIDYMALEKGYSLKAYQGVYSSDSTPFADKGVPALSFARLDPHDMQIIHNRYDTFDQMSLKHMEEDVEFIYAFAKRMDEAVYLPVKREIPQNMKDKLDEYMLRKKPEKK